MSDVADVLWMGLKDAFLMAYEVWWALVVGFAISAIVQAWVPRERIQAALSGTGVRPIAKATGLGAASSSCSYAAIAIAKSLFQKGASASSALAFQFASTNLVWELGLVLWVLIGWQFALAEYVGGIIMIILMALALRLFVSRELEDEARAHAQEAETGHQHHMAGEQLSWRRCISLRGSCNRFLSADPRGRRPSWCADRRRAAGAAVDGRRARRTRRREPSHDQEGRAGRSHCRLGRRVRGGDGPRRAALQC
ncbi:permease [Paraconexibacter antarcticus]|uniref:Permease n=1 Tax=Paraconexibacter antarcticus TaxID=2949664 RepID=A0ABY5DVS4_9ACTN|nr:permease [Paraconexibacter antarcticus]UTI65176.1 permease [Paraconexibacter antarcticus]